MSTYLQALGSTATSPLDMAYGAKCWSDLVASCYAAKCWADETDDDSDAYSTIPDVIADADTGATVSKIDPKADIDDIFSQPYVSFDWTKEDDDDAPATCPSLVSAVVPSLISRSTQAPLGPKFALGRFMETITEESEEEEEEEMMMMMDQDAEVDCESQASTELGTPTPSIPDEYRSFRTPAVEPIDELLDDLPPSHVSILKKLGVYSGYMHRKPITVKFPIATLSPTSHHQTNLSILAWAASTQEYAPFSNLDLLASCC
jgi:hypothetical protein